MEQHYFVWAVSVWCPMFLLERSERLELKIFDEVPCVICDFAFCPVRWIETHSFCGSDGKFHSCLETTIIEEKLLAVSGYLELYDFTNPNHHDLNKKQQPVGKSVRHLRCCVCFFVVLLPSNSCFFKNAPFWCPPKPLKAEWCASCLVTCKTICLIGPLGDYSLGLLLQVPTLTFHSHWIITHID